MSLNENSFLYSANADFIAELFQRYAADPASVDESWRVFFGGLHQDARTALTEITGASWAPAKSIKIISNENKGGEKQAQAPVALPASQPALQQAILDSIRAIMLIRVHRVRGHMQAQLDPLAMTPQAPHPELTPQNYGFTEADYDRPIFLDGSLGFTHATLREIMARLQATYCGHIGVEFMHMQDPAEKAWIQAQMEASENKTVYAAETKRHLLERLTAAEGFEKFLATKFVAVKRFGLEGGEAMIPALEASIERGVSLGLREVVLGMAHRGRLSVLTNVLGKPFTAMLAEFRGISPFPDSFHGSSDVKYHLGASTNRDFAGQNIHLTMNANPSHLEWVDPVVVGRARAKQQQRSASRTPSAEAQRQVMALLIHGDAAFAGQGIVGETLTLSALKGYGTGGTIHFVINNQVGFTTAPNYSRSGIYCTDIAKSIQAPIFHVNGDDLEAVVHVCELAAEFRQKFSRDAVIDMVCYRRHGHNESDEPAFTQPIMYRKIKDTPTTRELYAAQLINEGVVTQAEADAINHNFLAVMEQAYQDSAVYKPGKADWLEGKWHGFEAPPTEEPIGKTGVALDTLREVGYALARVPQDFHLNPKIAKQLDAKREMIETGEGIDWATAEALAFGTLLLEGTPVRLSGQDCGRGTFSQRHSLLIDQEDEHRFVPLNSIRPSMPATFSAHDSPLSEAAVMGFDYGFSLAEPNTLTCWEGQFGDFANTAQVLVDQFISSAETKWLRMSGLTLLLPHGYEGQGAEHSSARLERFLQLCAEDNMQVANCSTPANYFHILRRQMRRNYRKPLILMTPKSLLRHKLCVSPLSAMDENSTFLSVIPDSATHVVADELIRRVILCSGKISYDLIPAREEKKIDDVAIIRLEQFYPFPQKYLAVELARYVNATEVIWCQEEPENMGAWHFLDRRIEQTLSTVNGRVARPTYKGRPPSAATATGSAKRHSKEQLDIIDQILA